MHENLAVRDFHDHDHATLETMALALYAEDMAGEPMSPEKIHRTVQRLRQHPDQGRILLLTAAGRVVGYAILIRFWSNEFGGNFLVVDELYVVPERRGQGVGRWFLERVAPTLESDTVGLMLEVTPDNGRALALYRGLGFTMDPNTHLLLLRRDRGVWDDSPSQ